MRRTKREENSIIIYFSIYSIFIVVIIYLFLYKILPSIKEIEEVKANVQNTYSWIKVIEKEWITLTEFKNNVDKIKKSDDEKWEDWLYLTEVLKSTDDDFFNKHLKNTSESDYNTFIEELNKKYLDNSDFEDKTSVIWNILPVYSDEISDLWKNSLTDYKFINYIESISEVFNIKFDSSIWISELSLLEEYSLWWDSSALDTNIFYIPLSLNINWSKESILNFLYFIENVWKIWINKDLNVEVLNNVNKDFSEFKYKTLTKKDINSDYNIFNNYIFDIKSISFDEYIDSSFDLSDDGTTFISYLKNTQWNEEITAKIDLRFYVKWIPIFKIENYIKQFVNDFSKIKNDVDVLMSTTTQESPKYNKLLDINNKLNLLQVNVVSWIQKKLNTNESLDETYKQVSNYTDLLREYKKFLEDFNK